MHILPGIDDGSDCLETSLAMLAMSREQGIRRICCTPHFYAKYSSPADFLKRRAEAYELLARGIDGDNSYPELMLGAEVYYFDGMSASEDLPKLCLEGTELLLLEMPFSEWTDRVLGEVSDICRRGIQPVAAHIERYMSFNSRKTLRRLMEKGVWVQCNAEFFLDRRTSRRALHMLRDGEIQFLGSDAHNLTTRSPKLGSALELIEKKLKSSAEEYLLDLDRLRV